MAQGKFSKPRGRFETPRTPAEPERVPDSFAPWESLLEEDTLPGDFPEESPLPEARPQDPAVPPQEEPRLLPEEEAMDHAFAEVTGVNRRQSGDSGSFFLRNKKILLVGVCAFALILILGIIGFVAVSSAVDPYNGKILNNVLIGDIPVGGMTRSQAEAAVRSATQNTFTEQDMVVQLSGTALRFSPADTKAKLDVSAVVKAAYQYGRTGTQTERQAAYSEVEQRRKRQEAKASAEAASLIEKTRERVQLDIAQKQAGLEAELSSARKTMEPEIEGIAAQISKKILG